MDFTFPPKAKLLKNLVPVQALLGTDEISRWHYLIKEGSILSIVSEDIEIGVQLFIGSGNTICTIIMEISVVVPQEAVNRYIKIHLYHYTSRSTYTTFEYIYPKDLTHLCSLLFYLYSHKIENSLDVYQLMNG